MRLCCFTCRCILLKWKWAWKQIIQSETGWPHWANFRLFGDCLLRVVFVRIAELAQIHRTTFLNCWSCALIITKKMNWATIWATFFTNASGHLDLKRSGRFGEGKLQCVIWLTCQQMLLQLWPSFLVQRISFFSFLLFFFFKKKLTKENKQIFNYLHASWNMTTRGFLMYVQQRRRTPTHQSIFQHQISYAQCK
jgi:hypothetical protein